MTKPLPEEITSLLLAWGKGDKAAPDKLFPLVYEGLKRLAHSRWRGFGCTAKSPEQVPNSCGSTFSRESVEISKLNSAIL